MIDNVSLVLQRVCRGATGTLGGGVKVMLLGLLPANQLQFCLSCTDPARSMEQGEVTTIKSEIPYQGIITLVISAISLI